MGWRKGDCCSTRGNEPLSQTWLRSPNRWGSCSKGHSLRTRLQFLGKSSTKEKVNRVEVRTTSSIPWFLPSTSALLGKVIDLSYFLDMHACIHTYSQAHTFRCTARIIFLKHYSSHVLVIIFQWLKLSNQYSSSHSFNFFSVFSPTCPSPSPLYQFFSSPHYSQTWKFYSTSS